MSDQTEANVTDAVLGMEYNGAEGHETDTVASIVEEMRETWTDTPPCILSDLADRIKAAAERERDRLRDIVRRLLMLRRGDIAVPMDMEKQILAEARAAIGEDAP